VLDYINLCLTGHFVATVDSILTSWVTDNRDPQKVEYNDALIRSLGVDREKLPEIVSCTDVIGTLKSDVAESLGLPAGVKVVAGSIDNTAAAIGAGTISDYAVHVYIGTSSWMSAHVPFKKTDVVSSLASVPCALPNRYLLTALQATAGGNLTFLRDNILYHKDELLQEADVPDIFKVLDQIAERPPAGSNGVIYTPWIWGERAPVDERTLRAGLYNLSLNNNREDIIRAFLEGIAFNTRWLLDPFEKFIKRKVDKINIVGGGAQSAVWCQIFADVMNLEVRQVQDPVCANARGAAWIGAVGLGEIQYKDIESLTRYKNIYNPRSSNRAVYDEHFAVYKEIYKHMSGIYKRLNS
jgi:xylulokinase